MNSYDTNALRARILTQYVSDKVLAAAVKMDTEQIRTNVEEVDLYSQLLVKISKMTEEERDLFIQIIDLTEGRPDRLDFAASWTGRARDLPAALAQI